MMRDFFIWFNSMKPCINGYNYYIDFSKVFRNVDTIRIELNILNSLIGSQQIETDFINLLRDYSQILKCIPTLLAVRKSEIYAQDDEGGYTYKFDVIENTPEQYAIFMRKTGLFDMISNHVIANLVDYVMGVETGLDSNGRKNRGGHQMEDLVEAYLLEAGVEYYKEMTLPAIEAEWLVDLSNISAQGTTTKRFDFVVKTDTTIFLMETNFYTDGGSKLNETARSYKAIARETGAIEGVEFIWITDGAGWASARRNLEDTFNHMEHLYNIADMENQLFNDLFN